MIIYAPIVMTLRQPDAILKRRRKCFHTSPPYTLTCEKASHIFYYLQVGYLVIFSSVHFARTRHLGVTSTPQTSTTVKNTVRKFQIFFFRFSTDIVLYLGNNTRYALYSLGLWMICKGNISY